MEIEGKNQKEKADQYNKPLPSTTSHLVWINPNRMEGKVRFYNTRVLVKTLFDNLEAGMSINEFVQEYEGVTEEQVQGVLELAQSALYKVLSEDKGTV
jgi:uncharacterized protein (DUF433 family)